MGVADDLLALADHLASPTANDPEQIWLRRSVSTAYYALFHLLVGEAAQGWNGSAGARIALERAFEHKKMKEVSRTVSLGSWKGWSTPRPLLPTELQAVAKAFIDLQEARHQADYDNAETWARADARATIAEAKTAFQNWRKVRTDPAANEYLLSLLVGKKRE